MQCLSASLKPVNTLTMRCGQFLKVQVVFKGVGSLKRQLAGVEGLQLCSLPARPDVLFLEIVSTEFGFDHFADLKLGFFRIALGKGKTLTNEGLLYRCELIEHHGRHTAAVLCIEDRRALVGHFVQKFFADLLAIVGAGVQLCQ